MMRDMDLVPISPSNAAISTDIATDVAAEASHRSLHDPEAFWAEEAKRIDWYAAPTRILDASDPIRPVWFAGGRLNLCHNAVDRHLPQRAAQNALVYVSAVTGAETVFTYAQMYREVNAMAAVMQDWGVNQGDRVLLHLPVIPEAIFAMLACVRLGAIHNVVFAGFPAEALAHRIDDVTPVLIISASPRMTHVDGRRPCHAELDCAAGVEHALTLCTHRPKHHIDITAEASSERHAYAPLRAAAMDRHIPCVWMESGAPSYILHTSGTTGKPKGIVRDTGGHAVALAATLAYQFELQAGDTLFSTSDLGWVVGHSYGVYGPLIGGLTTVVFEGGTAYRAPDMLWRLAARYRVTAIMSAPTVMRAQRDSLRLARMHDLGCLRALYLAGEPLDGASARDIAEAIGKPVIDHYWQTETGAPILAAGRAVQGFRVQVRDDTATATPTTSTGAIDRTEVDSDVCQAGQRGLVCLSAPLPPGCMRTLWQDDALHSRLRATYWTASAHGWLYQTSDWGCADATGRIALSGRADDTINIAGQRMGTREIEETLRADPRVIDVAVLGFSDRLRGQVPLAFVVLDRTGLDACFDEQAWCAALAKRAVKALGRAARPRRVVLVEGLPRTRSGKVVRRTMREMVMQATQAAGPDQADLPSAEALSVLLA